jgi:hypothetical protein
LPTSFLSLLSPPPPPPPPSSSSELSFGRKIWSTYLYHQDGQNRTKIESSWVGAGGVTAGNFDANITSCPPQTLCVLCGKRSQEREGVENRGNPRRFSLRTWKCSDLNPGEMLQRGPTGLERYAGPAFHLLIPCTHPQHLSPSPCRRLLSPHFLPPTHHHHHHHHHALLLHPLQPSRSLRRPMAPYGAVIVPRSRSSSPWRRAAGVAIVLVAAACCVGFLSDRKGTTALASSSSSSASSLATSFDDGGDEGSSFFSPFYTSAPSSYYPPSSGGYLAGEAHAVDTIFAQERRQNRAVDAAYGAIQPKLVSKVRAELQRRVNTEVQRQVGRLQSLDAPYFLHYLFSLLPSLPPFLPSSLPPLAPVSPLSLFFFFFLSSSASSLPVLLSLYQLNHSVGWVAQVGEYARERDNLIDKIGKGIAKVERGQAYQKVALNP